MNKKNQISFLTLHMAENWSTMNLFFFLQIRSCFGNDCLFSSSISLKKIIEFRIFIRTLHMTQFHLSPLFCRVLEKSVHCKIGQSARPFTQEFARGRSTWTKILHTEPFHEYLGRVRRCERFFTRHLVYQRNSAYIMHILYTRNRNCFQEFCKNYMGHLTIFSTVILGFEKHIHLIFLKIYF